MLDAVVLRAPRGPRRPEHLCLDKGYDYTDAEAAVRARRISPHIRRIGEQPLLGCVQASLADGSWSGPTHGTTASAGCSCAGNESAPTTTVFFTLPARSSRSARPADIFGTGS